MKLNKPSAIIISASSDIGTELCKRWVKKGWNVYGTYRTKSLHTKELKQMGVLLFYCDLSNKESIKDACIRISDVCFRWDCLVFCPGTQDPVGEFTKCNFDKWEKSLEVNFSAQLRVLHNLYQGRNIDNPLGPCVLFFAGGGTNNATVNYSAYTISKIALIKVCELLDAEIPDTRFSIIGPGWVKTKIHEATLSAGLLAGDNYQRTINKLNGDECTTMKKVLDSCEWVIENPREVVGGRNFSTVFDAWGMVELEDKLRSNPDMYKLRRYGNDFLITD